MCKRIVWLGGIVLVLMGLQVPAWAAATAEDRNTPPTGPSTLRKELDRGVEIDPNG